MKMRHCVIFRVPMFFILTLLLWLTGCTGGGASKPPQSLEALNTSTPLAIPSLVPAAAPTAVPAPVAVSPAVTVITTLTPTPILTVDSTIFVDLNQKVTDNLDEKLGINLNFVREANNKGLRDALVDLGLSSLRFNEGEFGDTWLFNSNKPNKGQYVPYDTALWSAQLFASSDGYWDAQMGLEDFSELLKMTNQTGYFIFAIDSYVYKGSMDAKIAAMTKSERLIWLTSKANEVAIFIRDNKIPITHIEIGNENDLAVSDAEKDLFERWDASEYGLVAATIADEFHKVIPSIKVGVNGGLLIEEESNAWWNGVLALVEGKIDYVIVHAYSFWLDGYAQWRDGVNWKFHQGAFRVRKSLANNNISLPISVTEFSGMGNSDNPLRHWHTLQTVNMLKQHFGLPEVDMMHFWVSRWSSNENRSHVFEGNFKNNYTLTSHGKALKFFTDNTQSIYVEEGETNKVNWFATKNTNASSVTVFFINRFEEEQNIQLILNNFSSNATSSITSHLTSLTSPGNDPELSITDYQNEPSVAVTENNGKIELLLSLKPVSAFSVTLKQ